MKKYQGSSVNIKSLLLTLYAAKQEITDRSHLPSNAIIVGIIAAASFSTAVTAGFATTQNNSACTSTAAKTNHTTAGIVPITPS